MLTLLTAWLDSQSTTFNPELLYIWVVIYDLIFFGLIEEFINSKKEEK